MTEIEVRAGFKVTLVGIAVNGGLVALKLVGGILGHSHALVADAIHSVSDFFTDVVVLLGLRYGRQGPDETHPFGHARLETLASAVIGLTLIGAACLLAAGAAKRIYFHTEVHPNWLALAAALASIFSKEGLYRYTIKVGRDIKSAAVIANAWHHRSDALSSVAVVLGVAAVQFNPNWHVLDAVAALLVSFLVLKVGFEIGWQSLKELTDTSPGPEVDQEIEACVARVGGVREVHDLKVRSAGGRYQMEVHIVVDGDLKVREGHRIAKEVERCLFDEVESMARIIVHVDPSEEE